MTEAEESGPHVVAAICVAQAEAIADSTAKGYSKQETYKQVLAFLLRQRELMIMAALGAQMGPSRLVHP